MKKTGILFLTLISVLTCSFELFSSENIQFIRVLKQENIFDKPTGEAQYHIYYEVNVNRPQKYVLTVSYGNKGNYKAIYNTYNLQNGRQTIKSIFYGDNIFKNQIDTGTINEARLNSIEHSGKHKTEDTISLKVNFNYIDFERKIGLLDNNTDTNTAVLKYGNTLLRDQTRDNKIFTGILKPADLKKWFGVLITRPENYLLYSYTPEIRDEREKFIALSQTTNEIFHLRNIEIFNKYITPLNLKIENIEQAVNLIIFYIKISKNNSDLIVLHSLMKDEAFWRNYIHIIVIFLISVLYLIIYKMFLIFFKTKKFKEKYVFTGLISIFLCYCIFIQFFYSRIVSAANKPKKNKVSIREWFEFNDKYKFRAPSMIKVKNED